MQSYPLFIEDQMRAFYETLSEKDRRRYAAIEARKLGRGGITYITGILGCSRATLRQGMAELDKLPEEEHPHRQRRPGAGPTTRPTPRLISSSWRCCATIPLAIR